MLTLSWFYIQIHTKRLHLACYKCHIQLHKFYELTSITKYYWSTHKILHLVSYLRCKVHEPIFSAGKALQNRKYPSVCLSVAKTKPISFQKVSILIRFLACCVEN